MNICFRFLLRMSGLANWTHCNLVSIQKPLSILVAGWCHSHNGPRSWVIILPHISYNKALQAQTKHNQHSKFISLTALLLRCQIKGTAHMAGSDTYPTFGSPTIPIFKEVPKRPIRGGGFGPSPPFFGGICRENYITLHDIINQNNPTGHAATTPF